NPGRFMTYTLGKQLQAEGFVHITDVVATLGDAEVCSQRAEMAKGVFMHRP
ncbi:Type III effector HopQ1, partial [Pseudomonas amygdali pv. aesculi]